MWKPHAFETNKNIPNTKCDLPGIVWLTRYSFHLNIVVVVVVFTVCDELWAEGISSDCWKTETSPKWCRCHRWLLPLILSPWYNRTGWQGVKHKVTYLLTTDSVSIGSFGKWPSVVPCMDEQQVIVKMTKCTTVLDEQQVIVKMTKCITVYGRTARRLVRRPSMG